MKQMFSRFMLVVTSALVAATHSDAQDALTDSWLTDHSGQYARIYTSKEAALASNAVSTWTGQTLPAYSDIQQIQSSSNWIYVITTGLPSHLTGPWYFNAVKTALFDNLPRNQNATNRLAGMAATGVQSTGSTPPTSPGTKEFYRVSLDSLSDYDSKGSAGTGGPGGGGGGGGTILSVSLAAGARGTTFMLTMTLPNTAPPAMAPIMSVRVGTIVGTGSVHVSQTRVTSTITIPAGASPGTQTVTVVFPGPPQNPGTTETFTLSNGFTIN